MKKLSEGSALSRILLADMKAGYTLQQMIDDMYAHTGMPIIIMDLNNRVLLHAQCQSAGRIWDFAIRQGYLPGSTFQQLQMPGSRFVLMYKQGEGIILDPGEIDDCYHACVPLSCGGRPEGFLAVRFIEQEKAALAMVLAEKLGELYGYFAYSRTAETAYQGDFFKTYLARELLLYDSGDSDGLFSTAYPIRPGSGETTSRFRPGFCIAAIRALDPCGSGDVLRMAERDLPAFIPRSICLTSGQILLVMLFDLEENALSGDSQSVLLMQLDIFVRKHQLYCGLSSAFQDLSQRRNYKRQAMDALRLGAQSNPAGYLFQADELYTEVVLSEAVKRTGKQILTISDVTALVKYDAENKTSYLKTLCQYLRYNGRIAAASKSIFIDRGTMKYRLQKIQDLLQTDLDQPDTARLLRLGIAIYNASKSDPDT